MEFKHPITEKRVILCMEKYGGGELNAYYCPYAEEYYGLCFPGVICNLHAPAECPMKDPEKKILRAMKAKREE